MGNIWTGFKNWLAMPFQTGMSATGWFFFFGLLVAISVLWSLILKHTIRGIE
jgi:LPXTG-motif cell wall-anchored protein